MSSCPICLDQYDSQDRVPRILPCGHTVCQSCLFFLRLYDPAGHLAAGQPQCPTCRSNITTASLSQLPKNFSLLDSQVKTRTISCPLHGDQGLQALLFCLRCGVYVCHKCIATKHNSHQFEDLEKLSLQVKKGIRAARDTVKEREEKQESALNSYQAKRKALEASQTAQHLALRTFFDTLRAQLDSEQAIYEHQLTLLYTKDLEDLDSLIRLTEERLTLVHNIGKRWTTLEASLESMSDKEILELDKGASQLSLLKIESACLDFSFKADYRPHWYNFVPRKEDFTLADLGVIVQETEGKELLCLGSSSLPGSGECGSWVFSVGGKTWEEADMEVGLKAYSAACFLKEFQAIIITGGREVAVSKTTQILFPAIRKSDTRSAMLHARAGHSCVYHDSLLYVFGGFNEELGTLSSCESYDFTNDQWEERSQMGAKRALFGCSVWEKAAFLFGGFAKGLIASIEKYSFHSDKWTLLSLSLPSEASGIAACPHQGQILLLGGCLPQGQSNLVFSFDPNTLDIQLHSKMNEERAFAKAFSLGELVLVLGGGNGPVCEVLEEGRWRIEKTAAEPKISLEKGICVALS